MKIITFLALVVFSALSLNACVVVDKPGNGPHHCPPGHAKKGWC